MYLNIVIYFRTDRLDQYILTCRPAKSKGAPYTRRVEKYYRLVKQVTHQADHNAEKCQRRDLPPRYGKGFYLVPPGRESIPCLHRIYSGCHHRCGKKNGDKKEHQQRHPNITSYPQHLPTEDLDGEPYKEYVTIISLLNDPTFIPPGTIFYLPESW